MMKEEKRAQDGGSVTRRKFLIRAGKATVGLGALVAVGPAIVASTSKKAEATFSQTSSSNSSSSNSHSKSKNSRSSRS